MSEGLQNSGQAGSEKLATQASETQLKWLSSGMDQAGGKLPLFDGNGQRINERTIRTCIKNGWAEPWFSNPIKPDWLVCKITKAGRALVKRFIPR